LSAGGRKLPGQRRSGGIDIHRTVRAFNSILIRDDPDLRARRTPFVPIELDAGGGFSRYLVDVPAQVARSSARVALNQRRRMNGKAVAEFVDATTKKANRPDRAAGVDGEG